MQPLISEQQQPMPQEEQKESVPLEEEQPKEDPIKTALLEQLKQIEEQTNQIKSQLMTTENAAAAGGGGLADNSAAAVNKIMKKRRKTFYKKYKSKISMKRKNKTNRNK
jgi:hypothetical protein